MGRKTIQRVALMALCLAMMLTVFVSTASAESNVCTPSIRGSANDHNKWITFTVSTGSRWLGSDKITFTQTKGSMSVQTDGSGEVSTSTYGAYTIRVYNHSTGKTAEYYWKYKKDYPLKLDKNTTYPISIKAYKPQTVGAQNCMTANVKLHTILLRIYPADNALNWRWSSSPSWTVKSTKGINWCH